MAVGWLSRLSLTGLVAALPVTDRLYVTEATVKVHVSRILAKLGLRDRAQVVVFSYENGVVSPGE